ncbi:MULTISPECIES: cobyrinate a,c-diamide synthase [Rhodopseudomonas]|uniref:Hydrogenobyrinate a,c-diamide synthase n=1 Tax=Rhodopseudomonas palustris TaxID=1076 RepID=A0A0D7F6F4_RHOPL|nr:MULTISPECIES: cobyrinate a,c-diamide synthase [Rhodopseudomonas]KIZ47292.1 cobyrinic acid a,c-diamide synthase [Rhodopseudomonas palustris]MDF3812513.1 cobyrinate a,c-diamide synthase [Rhodopseudomonas sp. BAL398]WOK20662.1 cobyrinate a,c-diamide synthase [Rhodopseudomonas sp. BAL398]
MTCPPGLLIAAPSTHSGKTTLTLALLAALRRRGRIVQPYKSGPDYIDPAFHAVAAGRPSYNLDSWAQRRARIDDLLGAGADADLCIAEGVMGLFDGVATQGAWGNGASADIAAATGWPVVLVLDVAGQAQSAAAVALGFKHYRHDITIAGVILNKVASPRHADLVRAGFADHGITVFGAIARDKMLVMPERHLGLVQAQEDGALAARLAAMADLVERDLDLDALQAAARPTLRLPNAATPLLPPGQRIALARDAAFSFVYPHLLAGWRAAGAEIVPFSPLADEPPDDSCDVVWLPGGYPELHAGRLAAASRFAAAMRAFAQTKPVHGECGGYMTLGAGLIDAAGTRHAMLGLLGLETDFAQRRLHLGYRTATLLAPIPGCAAGSVLRGHEFHYASITAQPDPPLAEIRDASGAVTPETGGRRGHVTGSFFHMVDISD